MQRYFLEENYQEKNSYQLTDEIYHHIVHVMRMRPSEQIYLVFKDNQSILAEITEISDVAVQVKEVAKETADKELPVDITIASGFPKGEKLEWIVQKCTELGAYSFIGFPAKTSVVKWDSKKIAKKQQRLQKIVQEAAEQSHRQHCPTVSLVVSPEDFRKIWQDYDHILVAYEESAKAGEEKNLAKLLKEVRPKEKVLAIFGPEGGFAQEEIENFEAVGAILCGLGPRILRTETAPMYLLSAASFAIELLEDK